LTPPQLALLRLEVGAAFAAYLAHDKGHDRQDCEGDAQQDRAEQEHHDESADETENSGHELNYAHLEGHLYGVDVVGVAAHQFAVGVTVEVAKGQLLHFGEQVPAEGVAGTLGDLHHEAALPVGRHHADQVDAGQYHQRTRQAGEIARKDVVIDQRL
jgi:hypothetical protein